MKRKSKPQNIVAKVDPNRKYRPMDIVKEGIIVTASPAVSYQYVLKLIHKGTLKAVDFGVGTERPSFFVMGTELIRFLQDEWGVTPHVIKGVEHATKED